MKGESKMSVSRERIVEACRPILEEAGFHDAKTRHPRRFIAGYQIWFRLLDRNDVICDELRSECGDYVGKDSGAEKADGPVRRISDALGHCADIETQYIVTQYLQFNGYKLIEPSSDDDCGLFRLKE
jgi:hypothetical protein